MTYSIQRNEFASLKFFEKVFLFLVKLLTNWQIFVEAGKIQVVVYSVDFFSSTLTSEAGLFDEAEDSWSGE